jgi:hypothetical protein
VSEITEESVSRRDFLRLGVSITTGLVVPPVLTACGGGDSDSYDPPKETFVQPLTIQSVNGVLDVTLVLSYLNTTLFNPATGKDQQVSLRNMFGTIPAPTLSLNVGDLLRIKVFNNLPPNPKFPPTDPPQPPHLQYPNSTNLHTHGLHVFPGIVRPSSPSDPSGLYGDFVVDDPSMGIQPGETRQYEYRLRRIILRARIGITRTCTGRARCTSAAAWPACSSSRVRSTRFRRSPPRRSARSCSRRRSTNRPRASSRASPMSPPPPRAASPCS